MGRARTDDPGRRRFLKTAAGAAALTLIGCRGDSPGPSVRGGEPVCSDPFAGGSRLGTVPFVGEADPRMETKLQSGLAGRLFTDLSTLDEERMIVDADRFFIRSFAPDGLEVGRPWTIRARGLVGADTELSLSALEGEIGPMGRFLMECSGNGLGEHFGLMSACEWDGIPLDRVLERTGPAPRATRVLINGFDRRTHRTSMSTEGASWIFTPDQLQRAFLATHMNGQPIGLDHGFPARLFIPGWYGCAAIKWVDEIRWVDDDEPATSQMREFATRTHQDGVPEMARDYRPALMDLSATPVRVERWSLGGRTAYRIVGILWGGRRPTDRLEIRTGLGRPFEPVDVCPPQTDTDTWTLWSHRWQPERPGDHTIHLRVADPSRRTVRLDMGYYGRTVRISAV